MLLVPADPLIIAEQPVEMRSGQRAHATLVAGTDPARTRLGGSGKSAAAIHEAVARGIRITIDALDELPRIAAAARASGRCAVLTLRAKPKLDEPNDYRSVARPFRMGMKILLTTGYGIKSGASRWRKRAKRFG